MIDASELLLRKTTLNEAPGLLQFATLVGAANALSTWLLEHVFVDRDISPLQLPGCGSGR